ncbi:MAG TPA: hypothetical protein DIW48_04655 [Sphaerochaeta sp.]|nr:hypothetical protein [Sphaerochaeta sp.]
MSGEIPDRNRSWSILYSSWTTFDGTAWSDPYFPKAFLDNIKSTPCMQLTLPLNTHDVDIAVFVWQDYLMA